MLNNLSLIIVMILSLFLAFYCVDSHKSNILSIVNTAKKSTEPIYVKVEENLTKQEIKSVEKVYIEVLAVEDTNKTSKIVEEIKEVEKVEPAIEMEVVKEAEPQKIVAEEIKVKIDKTVEAEMVSEYSEGYKLDDLEKMILVELKKGNKE